MSDKIVFKDGGRLLVVAEDFNRVPYMLVYDDKQVYLGNDGEIRCLKCVQKVQMNWKRADRGKCWCGTCSEDRGTFKQVGYGVRVAL